MKVVTGDTAIKWESGTYVGTNRAMARATVQDLSMLTVAVDRSIPTPVVGVYLGDASLGTAGDIYSGQTSGAETYASAIYGQLAVPVELPNIKTLTWSRTIDTDTATLTLVLYNVQPLPLGETPENAHDFERVGYYTADRGTQPYSSRWGYGENAWQGRIAPDRVLRTYEGYGFDKNVMPEDDPNMYPSGVWLIDDVTYGADGSINISARDIGRALIDQICFPPVVPLAQYPLRYSQYQTVQLPPVPSGAASYHSLTYESDSGIPYVGKNGIVHGHAPSDAFDSNAATYWTSIGNGKPNAGYAFEYVQGTLGKPTNITSIKFQVWGGPYRCYMSVKSGGNWLGTSVIPYDPNNPVSAPNGSNIPYVGSFTVGYEQLVETSLNFKGVTSVRLTFTDLYDSGIGPYKYRAGVRSMQVNTSAITMASPGTATIGNYGDYSDIVKKLLAYGGFYWPSDGTIALYAKANGDIISSPAPSNDAVLGKGRIWGDIEETGTTGLALLDVPIWDKQTLMDGITYIRNIIAFIFYVDETGGAVWRSPNIWQIGNYVGDTASTAGYVPGAENLLQIDEELVLMDISVLITSRNVRENIFVANSFGKYGAVSRGYNPTPSGLRRVAGWTDQNFQSTDEAQRMADLIALRQAFMYRTDKVTIPGYPAFQIDDQVRIYERTTHEGYVHYISGIDSSFDMESGEWTYTLSTHWLGTNPLDDWAFYDSGLSATTIEYLTAIGKIGA